MPLLCVVIIGAEVTDDVNCKTCLTISMCQYLARYGFLLRFVWPYFCCQEWCTTRSAFLKLRSFSGINVKVWWWCHQSSWWMNKKAKCICACLTLWLQCDGTCQCNQKKKQTKTVWKSNQNCILQIWYLYGQFWNGKPNPSALYFCGDLPTIVSMCFFKSYWVQAPTYWHLRALVSLVSLMWHSTEFCCHLLSQ